MFQNKLLVCRCKRPCCQGNWNNEMLIFVFPYSCPGLSESDGSDVEESEDEEMSDVASQE